MSKSSSWEPSFFYFRTLFCRRIGIRLKTPRVAPFAFEATLMSSGDSIRLHSRAQTRVCKYGRGEEGYNHGRWRGGARAHLQESSGVRRLCVSLANVAFDVTTPLWPQLAQLSQQDPQEWVRQEEAGSSSGLS